MDIENLTGINFTEIFGVQISQGLNFLINIGIGIGIAVIIYILFLIISGVLKMKTASRIKKIEKNVEEINKKFDVLIEKFKYKKEKKEKDKK